MSKKSDQLEQDIRGLLHPEVLLVHSEHGADWTRDLAERLTGRGVQVQRCAYDNDALRTLAPNSRLMALVIDQQFPVHRSYELMTWSGYPATDTKVVPVIRESQELPIGLQFLVPLDMSTPERRLQGIDRLIRAVRR